ncbi:hypothetical protein [Hymenobacter glacialis]|uniref:hypothetical protein n=1 Tax=Hymenobacter glacialis TaxID=1908236 RepID=UPI000F79B8E5|nr:hypothetical protein [Hymenobacter glacialis]
MLRILCLLLFLSGPLCGQTLSDSTRISQLPPIYTPPARTLADTVAALHRVFANRRAGGVLTTALGGITLFLTPLVVASADDPSNKKHGSLGAFVFGAQLGLAIATPIMAYGIYQLSRGAKAKEEQVIFQYTQVRTLPRKLAKRLRPEHFIPVNSLPRYR